MPVELDEKLRDTVLGPAGGVHTRASVERCDFDARVLADDPSVRRRMQSTVTGLDPCVVDERRAVLDGLVGRLEERDLQRGQRLAKLVQLVRVRRGEKELHVWGELYLAPTAEAQQQLPPARR